MRVKDGTLLLYAVTDRGFSKGQSLISQVGEAIRGGATCVQLREKDLAYGEFLKEALEMKKLCDASGIPLIINDNAYIAAESGASGVHIGPEDMDIGSVRKILGDKAIIGVSARTSEAAREAEADGADYIGCGAVFGTDTKPDARAISLDILREVAHSVSIPVVAIGGINASNVSMLSGTGIAGAAIVSGIFAAKNIKGRCIELRHMLDTIVE